MGRHAGRRIGAGVGNVSLKHTIATRVVSISGPLGQALKSSETLLAPKTELGRHVTGLKRPEKPRLPGPQTRKS